MHNLKIVYLDNATFVGSLPLTATAWDSTNDSIICAFGPTPTQPVIELKRKTSLQNSVNIGQESRHYTLISINSWDAPCPLPELECDEVLLMHHFPETLTTCLVLAGGDLVLVREEPEEGQDAIEIVGSIDVGISAAAWAPDEELLAIVTRADNLILMSRHLEPVNELSLTPEDLTISKHVSVGWGKKETQFQGKRAKALRDPTMPEHVDEGQLSRCEDHSTSVSWRGDGAYFAVNAVIRGHRRAIRVFSREGVLDSISEPVDGLESSLSWRPYGNLIASLKRSEPTPGQEKLEVVFFERNGLRHGGFVLRLDAVERRGDFDRIALQWNLDSSVLAVSTMGSVQFWTMSNYHYYLKQNIHFPEGVAVGTLNTRWHPEKPLKCALAGANEQRTFEFLQKTHAGSTISPYDFGIAGVIDGSTLKLTPFKHAGVPPPMAFCELHARSDIVDCAFSSDSQHVAVLTQNTVEVFNWEMKPNTLSSSKQEPRHSTKLVKRSTINLRQDAFGERSRQWTQICFKNQSEIYVLSPATGISGASCLRSKYPEDAIDSSGALDTTVTEVSYLAQNIISDIKQQAIWVQDLAICKRLNSNTLSSLLDELWSQNGHPNKSIYQTSSPVAEEGQDNEERSHHTVLLTTKGALYADDRLLARDCTSYTVTESYLIYTTAQHLLKFVHLVIPEKMDVPGDTPEVDERCRSIERGAKIVTVIPSIYAAILQMPRGNLETIYPRVLVLSGIRKSIQNLDYRTAFLACQNHQVDMNILYDHLPAIFMSNVGKFIEELKKPSRIDEFLSKLKEEDVTQTLYRNTLEGLVSSNNNGAHTDGIVSSTSVLAAKGAEKVNQICNAFLSALNNRPTKFLQNIITAHVCKRPPDLTAALTLVSSLRRNSAEEAEVAISHLCFLTDTNRLYDAALALYDLELTLLVAQNAQRDPREYMPFLQSLQALPSLRRQYQIDNHLRNYSKALVSLHSLNEHQEVQAYTIKHNLYTTSMELYKYDTTHLPKITVLYAEHLESLSQYASAATLYESLGDNNTAYPLYALAHQWREALTCAALVPLESDKLQGLATSLATSCAEESRDYRAAATIHSEYLNDIPNAARLLCKGSYFAEASRILSHHQRYTSEISTIIDPGLTEKFGEIIELVADCRSQLAAQVSRITELRIKKAEDPLAFYGGDAAAAMMAADGVDIPDNISLAPSDTSTMGGQSLFTRYGSNASKFGGTVASNVSRKTSRTKRREERKRARGKKGSVYEEEYLVGSIGRLIERLNGVQDEVRRLISGLLRRALRDQGKKVDEVMSEINTLCEKACKEVWQVDGYNADPDANAVNVSTYDVNGEGRPSGADGVLWDSQQELLSQAMQKKQRPEVKKWSGSPLVLK